ncbi:hypothetical protein DMENIID0001_143830 [Sergentomyia squamirostris]
MNGIRQYFSSVAQQESPGVEADLSQSRKKGNFIVSNMESVIKSVKKQSKTKKRKEKVSGDGEIVDISNILSTSLNFISPAKSDKTDVLNGHDSPEEKPLSVEAKVSARGKDEKTNVFLVMMQARNKNNTSTPNPPTSQPDQEITEKVSKKRKRSPSGKVDAPKEESTRKASRRKKLFEIEVETVDYPRKIKDPEENPQIIESIEEVPKKKKSGKRRKLFVEEAGNNKAEGNSEPPVLQEESKPTRRTRSKTVPQAEEKVEQVVQEQKENLVNGKQVRAKRKPQKAEIEEIIIESDVDSPSQRPRRSCRQKIVSYSLDKTFLDDDRSPEKVKTPKRSGKVKEIISIDVDSPTKPRKLAPIFVKKPEIDPEVLKAKQNFLMSGIPEKMRQFIEKQKAAEELFELNLFPTVSHVAQIGGEMREISWTDGRFPLEFTEEIEDLSEEMTPKSLTFSLIDQIPEACGKQIPGTDYLTSSQQKGILRKLSKDSEDFPWKRVFAYFKRKQEVSEVTESPHEDNDDSIEIIEEDSTDNNLLFTEKYRPVSSEEFQLNRNPVEELKRFLLDFQSVNRRLNSTFESLNDPEESTGSNFSNSCCVVLSGPCGSGKSAAVAAVATELNMNVLEINAGQRRSGKKILQELQEATKSHKISQKSTDELSHRFSLILVEDAEIAFEQDDGFVGALHQIVSDSKRPVILTTSDSNCQHLERFIAMNVIHFEPPEPEEASRYLTVMSLAEGLSIPQGDIAKRYMMNHRDFRKTTLDLEFFIKTGGDFKFLNERSYDTLSANTSSWLRSSTNSVDDLANFYDILSSGEIFNSTSQAEQISETLVDQALIVRNINSNTFDHFLQPRAGERSCLYPMVSGEVACVDVEPILRSICRSEKEKAARERKSSRFYHYLRQIVLEKFFLAKIFWARRVNASDVTVAGGRASLRPRQPGGETDVFRRSVPRVLSGSVRPGRCGDGGVRVDPGVLRLAGTPDAGPRCGKNEGFFAFDFGRLGDGVALLGRHAGGGRFGGPSSVLQEEQLRLKMLYLLSVRRHPILLQLLDVPAPVEKPQAYTQALNLGSSPREIYDSTPSGECIDTSS